MAVLWVAWCITVIGWLLVPIINFLLSKLFAYLDFDIPRELKELELYTVPPLHQTLRDVTEERMLGETKDKQDKTRPPESHLKGLQERENLLKSALDEAEDILDLVEYHRIQKEAIGDKSIWQHLHDAVDACIAYCKASWSGRWIEVSRAKLLQWSQSLSQKFKDIQAKLLAADSPAAQLPTVNPQPAAQPDAPSNPATSWPTTVTSALRPYWDRLYEALGKMITTCYQLILSVISALPGIYSLLCSCRDWSYEVIGIQKDDNEEGCLVPINERIRTRRQIKRIKGILKKESDLRNQNISSNTAKDTNEESRSSSKNKEIEELHEGIEQMVFGRDGDRENICRMLLKEPSSSTGKPYSVIGIHGITGSGKSTLAKYVCDYEKNEAKHFNPIMFVHVRKTFNLGDVFRDMLEQIKQSRPSDEKDLKSLREELVKELKNKCFLLVLDDLWVTDGNNEGQGNKLKTDERYQKELGILLDALCAGRSGSRILVTGQRGDAAADLGAHEDQIIKIPDLEEENYLKLFMHHALPGTVDDHGKFERIGSKIAAKLHRSPIAAVTVAKQLRRNRSIDFWKPTADLDVLNETMGALWWSYQQLGVDTRQCFAYCSTFPRGHKLKRDELVRIWIAQGLVNTSNAAEELEDVGLRYIQELLNFSFVQLHSKRFGAEEFIIHDLLHELAERVAGSDFFRIGLNDLPKDIPPCVRHLFIETENVAEATEKILDLGNLRTLIIKEHSAETNRMQSMEVEERNQDLEKTFERLFMRLRKLRVLIIKLDRKIKLLLPASIDQMMHLRYFGFHISVLSMRLNLPSTISKLYHMQTICVPIGIFVYYPDGVANLIHLRHITGWAVCPNVGRLTSLRTMEYFLVKKEQGYELRQLKHLNKLRGTLELHGLGDVGSKEEALEADLASKKGVTKLSLLFCDHDHQNRTKDPDIEAEVLEGLCPPKDVQELSIFGYKGPRYPSWMLSSQHADAPKHLHRLELTDCSRLASFPKDGELFSCLLQLEINICNWDSLPENMEFLRSLQGLRILFCENMKLLPTLPRSLNNISIFGCGVLNRTCQEEEHQNWRKIQHIPNITIGHWIIRPPEWKTGKIFIPLGGSAYDLPCHYYREVSVGLSYFLLQGGVHRRTCSASIYPRRRC